MCVRVKHMSQELIVSKIAAVVVGYEPDIKIMDELLSSLLNQVDLLILADNGGAEGYLAFSEDKRSRVKYVQMGGNKGLGVALNAGFECATEFGMDYLVTFDQDSHAQPDLIAKLLESMKTARAKDEKCAAVSPVFFDRRDGLEINFPFYQSVNGSIRAVYKADSPDGLVMADVLITSGMMIRTDVWQEGAKYNDGMFVDFTDSEWCFRVRSLGYHLYGSLNVSMGHALSDAPPVKFLGFSFFRYSPIRRYFYFRNTVAVCQMGHTPACWRRRLLSALLLRFFVNLLIDKEKIKSLKMMLKGIKHGRIMSLGGVH